jgi:nucleoside-diphosphate-sugar epimerase
MATKHTILITGAAGYVGSMLVQQFALREDVEKIIGLDKEPLPEMINTETKLTYLEMNTADDWEDKVRVFAPDIVIHSAWQIREMYGHHATEWKWNITGSDKVFDFAFGEPSVKRLIHFSTVASYGAFPTNSIDHRYTEDEPFKKSQYLYAEEKRICEEHLKERYEKAQTIGSKTAVAIIRPAAITGPRGRFMRIRFGLQAALAGQLKDAFVYRLISAMVSFVPVTPKWLRQFIHEDDVVDLVALLAFAEPKGSYEVFNICPPGDVVLGPDMAKATGPGAWRGYSYPIAVDGSKLTKEYGFVYSSSSFDAFYYTNGRYEDFVPDDQRRHKG